MPSLAEPISGLMTAACYDWPTRTAKLARAQCVIHGNYRSCIFSMASVSVFARIERGQGADLGKGHFCARPIILRALLRVILHFEGTMGK